MDYLPLTDTTQLSVYFVIHNIILSRTTKKKRMKYLDVCKNRNDETIRNLLNTAADEMILSKQRVAHLK